MFTLVGFYDATTHAELAAVDAIPDPHVRVLVNDIYVPIWNRLLAVLAEGQNISECRIQSPSLRRLVNQRIAPINVSVSPTNTDRETFLHVFKDRPRVLDVAEALNAYCVNGGDTDEFILVWLMDKLEALPTGEIITIEGSASVTTILGQWVNAAVTFTQTLPAGRYSIVGMRTEDTDIEASRLVFPDMGCRPGCPNNYDVGSEIIPLFRYGGLGSWGEFEHDAPPTVDFLGNVADTVTPEVILDLIQIRAGRR